MLALDNRISSDELNRSLFKVMNEEELHSSIEAIRTARGPSGIKSLGPETITGKNKNDRIIPWVSLASFGWTLFPDKRRAEAGAYYELDAATLPVIKEAAQVRHRHRDDAAPVIDGLEVERGEGVLTLVEVVTNAQQIDRGQQRDEARGGPDDDEKETDGAARRARAPVRQWVRSGLRPG